MEDCGTLLAFLLIRRSSRFAAVNTKDETSRILKPIQKQGARKEKNLAECFTKTKAIIYSSKLRLHFGKSCVLNSVKIEGGSTLIPTICKMFFMLIVVSNSLYFVLCCKEIISGFQL